MLTWKIRVSRRVIAACWNSIADPSGRAARANLLVRYSHDDGLALRVRGILRETIFSDWPWFETMAKSLDMSPATLRRQLRDERQSILAIKDALHSPRAQTLLRKGILSMAEIAAETVTRKPASSTAPS